MDPIVLFILIILGALLLGILGYQVYSIFYERERMIKNAYMQFSPIVLQTKMTEVTEAIGRLNPNVSNTKKAIAIQNTRTFLLGELSLMQEALRLQKKL